VAPLIRASPGGFVSLLPRLAFALLASSAIAAPLAPAASAEIDALLSRLESSGCQFNRNGSWYPAPEARDHLVRKLDWLKDKGLVESAEQFIERAASGSSVSGKPYLVRCGNGAPVESRTWLTTQLKSIRASGAR
jgi:hypothetical protein